MRGRHGLARASGNTMFNTVIFTCVENRGCVPGPGYQPDAPHARSCTCQRLRARRQVKLAATVAQHVRVPQ